MRRILAVSMLCVTACAQPTPPPVSVPGATPPPSADSAAPARLEDTPLVRDDGRLPGTATPRHYTVGLAVDPTQERFTGHVTIEIDVPKPTSHVVLHARNLTIHDVTATAGSAVLVGTPTTRLAKGGVAPEELVLSFPQVLPAGRAVLTITYDGPFDAELSGLYRVKDGERWYAFTQFETTAARRAFPCFDEPGFKVPFDLEITAPKGMLAVANTPETSRADADAGTTHFVFATTPPLPSYLLAFAVGDFDVREGVKSPVPIRLLATKGKGGLGDFALDATAGLVKVLGDYFAIPYPFAKLDIVAVPEFAAGAMENPGLITFREELLLTDPAHPALSAKTGTASTIAHELAHMWFGDLVTMKWWNDVWLNEGFATWMDGKAVEAWHPEYGEHLDRVAAGLRVMDLDATASARAIRQPVTTTSEIEEAFDGLSYEKGAATLGMIERWIGADAMRTGVRDYLKAHSWQNAEEADLMGALDHASDRDVSAMAATFLDRPGVPNVTFTPTCDGDKLTFGLAQAPWRPLGSDAKTASTTPWKIPVCVQSAGGDACTELDAASGSFVVGGASCKAWVSPNAGASGYYRSSLPEARWQVLAGSLAKLDAATRMGLVSDLWAQVRAGTLEADALLRILPSFDHETDSHVLGVTVRILAAMDRALVDDRTQNAFRAYVAARFARAKRRLGWLPKLGESAEDAKARPLVLGVLGDVARDATTLREAEAVAKRWLADPTTVDPDVASVAVPLASIRASLPRLAELRAVLLAAKTPLDRVTALRAAGTFADTAAAERAWAFALSDDVRQQDARYVLEGLDVDHDSYRVAFPWLAAHWNALRKKTPVGYEGDLVEVVGHACDDDGLASELAFFEPRVRELEGATRPLAENTDTARTCIALRKHGAASVAKFFKR